MNQMPVGQIRFFPAPFDAVADRYDETFTASKIGQAQRTSVWKELEKVFRPKDRVLELGCGTGVDARFLALRGITVFACDSSPLMIAAAQRNIEELTSPGEGPVHLGVLRIEEISSLRKQGLFDGVFSNFGALNCIEDLRSLAIDLATLVKPGSPLVLCLMGPCCVWEIAWYLAERKPRKAFRRLRRGGVSTQLADGAIVHVHYPTVRWLKRAFFPEFRLKSMKGIGVLVPPSYGERWAARFPRLFDICLRADSVLGSCPGIRILADHILLKFERVET
jgi:SAM-dependent methyltransferase